MSDLELYVFAKAIVQIGGGIVIFAAIASAVYQWGGFTPGRFTRLVKVPLLRWLVAWGALADGLIGIATFGMCQPSFQLAAAKRLAKARYLPH